MSLSEAILKSALAAIPVSELEYNDWIRVGMALKTSGCDCSVWEEWSRADSRFHNGECEKKWKGFNRGEVTVGTIRHFAKRYGWNNPDAEVLDWDSEIEFDGYESKIRYKAEGTAQTEQLITFLETLFKPDDIVGYIANVTDIQYTDSKYKPKTIGNFTHTAAELIAELKAHPDDIGAAIGGYNENCGGWIRMNPMDGKGGKDENVLAFRYALVEADTIPVEDQKKKYLEYQLPIAALVYSGGKSMHAVIRIDAKDAEEYKQRVEFLFGWLKSNDFPVDEANKNPSRNMRMPGLKRGDKIQKLLGMNQGKASWADWYQSVTHKGLADYLREDFSTDIEENRHIWKTGFSSLDEAWGGLHAGLYVIGAPSSVGKTTFCLQLADQVAASGEHVLFFSLEQTRSEMACKSLARYAAQGIGKGFNRNTEALSAMEIRSGISSRAVEAAKEKYIKDVENRLTVVANIFGSTISDITRQVKSYAYLHKVKPLVIVDYLQIIQSDKDQETRQNIDYYMGELKKLSNNGFPVVVISSYNRSNYEKTGSFECFKESGGIEYSADVVCTLELSVIKDLDEVPEGRKRRMSTNKKREKVDTEKQKPAREITFKWLKNRYGIATGQVEFNYWAQYELFIEGENPYLNFN